jgi:hypothetical protein
MLWYVRLCSDDYDYRLVIMEEKAEVKKTCEVDTAVRPNKQRDAFTYTDDCPIFIRFS